MSTLYVRLKTAEQKQQWKALAQQSGKSQNALAQAVIERVLESAGAAMSVQPSEKPVTVKGKKTIRLTAEENHQLEKLAAAEGMKGTAWIVAMLRAALHRQPIFNDQEVRALWRATDELIAIGRNLNQVAKAINANKKETDRLKLDLVETLAKHVGEIRARIDGVVDASLNRWGGAP